MVLTISLLVFILLARKYMDLTYRRAVERAMVLQQFEADKSPSRADFQNLLPLAKKTSSNVSKTPPRLPPEIINGVKNFVFFVGYERSGDSIVGALLDTHPHVVIPQEFLLFEKFPELNIASNDSWKGNLFTSLYERNINNWLLSSNFKGRMLKVEGLWQGGFQDHIEVIGDQSGGLTTRMYLEDRETFTDNFEKLQQVIGIPIRVIHVLRNPFDIISTEIAFNAGGGKLLKCMWENCTADKTSSPKLQEEVEYTFTRFNAVREIIDDIIGRENAVEIHYCDLVADPTDTLSKVFNFLEVGTTGHFLDVCAEKVFKSVSRSRDWIVWPQEQVDLVEAKMKRYEMFSRYSFKSD